MAAQYGDTGLTSSLATSEVYTKKSAAFERMCLLVKCLVMLCFDVSLYSLTMMIIFLVFHM